MNATEGYMKHALIANDCSTYHLYNSKENFSSEYNSKENFRLQNYYIGLCYVYENEKWKFLIKIVIEFNF